MQTPWNTKSQRYIKCKGESKGKQTKCGQGTDEQMMASSPSFGCRITSSSTETSVQPGSSQQKQIPIKKKNNEHN